MRLTVAIPSRGRPFGLKATVEGLQRLASGRHDITYAIGCDADDPQTLQMARILWLDNKRVIAFVTERLGSLGQMVNLIAQAHPADAYCSLCDDVEIMTAGWDEAIARAWAARPDGVWWWRTLNVRPATYAVVSEHWRQAAGRIFTDYFPFWWDDMYLMQLWRMAIGEHLFLEAGLDDRAHKTQRMRDLAFWGEFYTALKPQRRVEAARIASLLGHPAGPLEDTVCDVRPEFWSSTAGLEAQQGEAAPPTPEYIRARARAARLLEAIP